MTLLPLPAESNLGASYVNLMMSKYRHFEGCKMWHCVQSRGSNSILKRLAVVGDVLEVMSLCMEYPVVYLVALFFEELSSKLGRWKQAGWIFPYA